ncbi:MAG: NrdH-redoxin [Actinomycetia bacterium]|nr:NrdH-redoxin [Actinomycetes bacterium]
MAAEITVYGADWCGDCRRTKQYLGKNDIAYVWVDVEANPHEIATVMKYNNGRKSIPVVVFSDGTHLTEPSEPDMDAKLGR